MMKNKAIHAIIIGSCLIVNSMAGVYADTTAPDEPVSIQLQQVNYDEGLMQKQSEIDEYVFRKDAKVFADKGITVTNTGVMGEYVEVGITPFNEENADYIYEIFGKDKVKVVEGIQATTFAADAPLNADIQLDVTSAPQEVQTTVSAPVEKEVSPIAAFFSSIWEWIKSIF